MDSRRIKNLRNSFDKNIVDKQVDKIFETGRQFVDGVSVLDQEKEGTQIFKE